MPIRIFKLDADNADLLETVAPEVFDYRVQAEYLEAFINDPRHVMFIAAEDKTVVGMASAVEYFHPDKAPQLWINEVGVAATHRGQRIGRQLVAALVDDAKDRRCTYAWLGTDVDNHPAQRCFGSHPDVEDPQPFLLYEWEL